MHNGEVMQAIVANIIYMPKDLVLCVLAAFLARAVYPALQAKR